MYWFSMLQVMEEWVELDQEELVEWVELDQEEWVELVEWAELDQEEWVELVEWVELDQEEWVELEEWVGLDQEEWVELGVVSWESVACHKLMEVMERGGQDFHLSNAAKYAALQGFLGAGGYRGGAGCQGKYCGRRRK
ncbi:hypothetical protein JZ751_009347 [Albula glossodonta]|uniref:Uncharacterized protein n=1 Tax=Albula glossodonta TaxID=121402 RepID=A0A8T2N1F6_9TELE|nr:hypothetical protein JZ751_009347 [Albula glossodonta]